MTVNATSSSSHANPVNPTTQSAARKTENQKASNQTASQAQAQAQAQKNGALAQDKVTLSSAAQPSYGIQKNSGASNQENGSR